MTGDDAPRSSRRALLGAGAALLGTLAGCSGPFGADRPSGRSDSELSGSPADAATAGTAEPTRGEAAVADADRAVATGTDRPAEPLHVQDSGALRDVVDGVVRSWNRNPTPEAGDRWRDAAAEIGTEARLADHFAAEHGIEPTRTRSDPPFAVVASTSEPEPIARDLAAGRVDLGGTNGDAIGAVRDDWPDLVGHAIAREGSAFVVSPAIAEAGVTSLTAEQIRAIYAGEIGDWATVGGPDREPYVVTGPDGTPNRRIRREFFDRGVLAGVDVRYGKHGDRARVVRERDDAIADLAAGYATEHLPAPAVVVDGTAYEVRDPGYPTTHEAALYTPGPPDAREAAVLDALGSPVGQRLVEWQRDLVVPNR